MKDLQTSGIQDINQWKHAFSTSQSMFISSLKFALLVAVATNQILGGILCCCIGKTFAASFTEPGSIVTTQTVGQASPTEVRPVCPKCVVRKVRPSEDDGVSHSTMRCRDVSAEKGDPCRCVKLDLALSVLSESKSFVPDETASDLLHFGPCERCEVKMTAARNHIFPDLLGGRSWQSITCVWRN